MRIFETGILAPTDALPEGGLTCRWIGDDSVTKYVEIPINKRTLQWQNTPLPPDVLHALCALAIRCKLVDVYLEGDPPHGTRTDDPGHQRRCFSSP